MSKRILVNGACGRMGSEVVRTIINDTEHRLVGACDRVNAGKNIIELLNLGKGEVIIYNELIEAIKQCQPEIIVDFTSPLTVMENIEIGLSNKVNMIVGTTGITEVDLKHINELVKKYQINALIVPNFAIGAVLMMKFAAEAARYLDDVEIIELHHDQKIDAPSGTALKTAQLISNYREKRDEDKGFVEIEKLNGARGGNSEGIHIHSVRLPGLVAHQEVIFGAEGQSLTIRHDSYHRKSFMPGVRLALDKICNLNGVVYGLEKLLD